MMLYLYVQQNRWIVEALMIGGALTLLFCLTYHDMWRPRQDESEKESAIKITGVGSFLRWVTSFAPWAVLLLVLVSLAYTAAHLLAATRLPNW